MQKNVLSTHRGQHVPELNAKCTENTIALIQSIDHVLKAVGLVERTACQAHHVMSFYGGYPLFLSRRTASMHTYFHTPIRFIISTFLITSTLLLTLHILAHCPSIFTFLYHITSNSFQLNEQTHAIVRSFSISIAHSYTPTPLHSCSFSRTELSRHGQVAWNTRLNGMESLHAWTHLSKHRQKAGY